MSHSIKPRCWGKCAGSAGWPSSVVDPFGWQTVPGSATGMLAGGSSAAPDFSGLWQIDLQSGSFRRIDQHRQLVLEDPSGIAHGQITVSTAPHLAPGARLIYTPNHPSAGMVCAVQAPVNSANSQTLHCVADCLHHCQEICGWFSQAPLDEGQLANIKSEQELLAHALKRAADSGVGGASNLPHDPLHLGDTFGRASSVGSDKAEASAAWIAALKGDIAAASGSSWSCWAMADRIEKCSRCTDKDIKSSSLPTPVPL